MSYPATKIAKKRRDTPIEIELAVSLACYVSIEDMQMTRREFLETVRDRIELDLHDNTY